MDSLETYVPTDDVKEAPRFLRGGSPGFIATKTT